MKIRSGFVSNSSSASYIVTLKYEEDMALSIIREAMVLTDNIKQYYEDLITRYKNNVDASLDGDSFFAGMNRRCKDLIKELESKVEFINRHPHPNAEEQKQITIDYITSLGIVYKYEGEELELSYFTSMHNDYLSGMPSLLAEIILVVLFNDKSKIKVKIDEDS